MVRLADLTDVMRTSVTTTCPSYDTEPWTAVGALSSRTVAIVSSAGLGLRSQRPFRGGEGGYRDLPHDAAPADILMSHISVNFDRAGYQLDLETILPRGRLAEFADAGVIGAVADTHYSFMGATDPGAMEADARALAAALCNGAWTRRYCYPFDPCVRAP